jgi:hypothetical protein
MNTPEPSSPNLDLAASTPGHLPAPARRALVELMRQGVVMAESRRLIFDALCQHRALIADHLADMYLRVLIDEPAGNGVAPQHASASRQ